MEERTFEKFCGNCAGIDINTITEDDIRKQAEIWTNQGEPCTEDEICDAIAHLNEMKKETIINESIQGVIDEVLQEAEGDVQSAIYALEDGEYLETKDWNQEDIEEAHFELNKMLKK